MFLPRPDPRKPRDYEGGSARINARKCRYSPHRALTTTTPPTSCSIMATTSAEYSMLYIRTMLIMQCSWSGTVAPQLQLKLELPHFSPQTSHTA